MSNESELKQSNVSLKAYPIPVAGRLSRRAVGTSFLDANVYLDVLSCPLDSEISGCDDCDIQGGPATPTVGAGTDVLVTTTTPAGPAPTGGGTEGCVAISYYQDDRKDVHEYHGYEFYPLGTSLDVCPEIIPPDWTRSGADDSMPAEMTGIPAFGDTCTYKSNGAIADPMGITQVGNLECNKWRDAPCWYDGTSGTCENGWQTYRYLVNCDWSGHYGNESLDW